MVVFFLDSIITNLNKSCDLQLHQKALKRRFGGRKKPCVVADGHHMVRIILEKDVAGCFVADGVAPYAACHFEIARFRCRDVVTGTMEKEVVDPPAQPRWQRDRFTEWHEDHFVHHPQLTMAEEVSGVVGLVSFGIERTGDDSDLSAQIQKFLGQSSISRFR